MYILFFLFLSLFCETQGCDEMINYNKGAFKADAVSKHVLDNGMTVLVRPIHTIPKVSIQLWYHVGSKDEKDS